jgi:carbon-monoxide dehydrogenase large subunit
MENDGIGQPVRRREDVRLLTGRGTCTGDIDRPGQARMAVVRSTPEKVWRTLATRRAV